MVLAGKKGGFVVEHLDEESPDDIDHVDHHVAKVAEYLKSEGFRPEVLDKGRVYFKFEGHHLYFGANPNDDQRFDIFIPNVWTVESTDRDIAIKTAHHVTDRMGCVKVVVLENGSVWVLYEGFYASVEAFLGIINRVAERLQYGARRFIDDFNEVKKAKNLQ